MKMQYSRVKDVKELYAMNRMVYLEYRVYDADSALHYINKNIQLAQQTNNRTWEVVSLLEQSFVLTSSGLLTEALKAENQLEWVRRMNSIRNRAEEIIQKELIFI